MIVQEYFIMITEPIPQDIAILNPYASNNSAIKYVKEKLTEQKEVENLIIIVGDFSTPSQ